MSYPNDTGEQVIKTIIAIMFIAAIAVFFYDAHTPIKQKYSDDLMTVEWHEDNWDTEAAEVTDIIGVRSYLVGIAEDSGFMCGVIETGTVELIWPPEVNK